jgi:hypothetical protein
VQGFPDDLRLLRLDFILWWLINAHLGQIVSRSLLAFYFFAQKARYAALCMNMVASKKPLTITAWVFRLLENCVLVQR